MSSRKPRKEPESVYRSLPAIKARMNLAPPKKGKLVPPTGSTLGLFNQSSFVRQRHSDPQRRRQRAAQRPQDPQTDLHHGHPDREVCAAAAERVHEERPRAAAAGEEDPEDACRQ